MMGIGILFVVNSLDSLTRLYTQNTGLTVEALGTGRYIATNWAILFVPWCWLFSSRLSRLSGLG